MLSPDELEKLRKGAGIKGEAGIFVEASDDFTQMNFTIFALSGRRLCVADILAGIAQFQTLTIQRKVLGDLKGVEWSPQEAEANHKVEKPRVPGKYWDLPDAKQ